MIDFLIKIAIVSGFALLTTVMLGALVIIVVTTIKEIDNILKKEK
jgi:hypothetical protein